MITEAKRESATNLSFDEKETHALTHLPPEIAALPLLNILDLDNTQISDLAPLAAMIRMKALFLDNTQINDLAPLAAMTGIEGLYLNNTQISDLRGLRGFTKLAEAPEFGGLQFENCAAALADPRIAELAAIEDAKNRAARCLT